MSHKSVDLNTRHEAHFNTPSLAREYYIPQADIPSLEHYIVQLQYISETEKQMNEDLAPR